MIRTFYLMSILSTALFMNRGLSSHKSGKNQVSASSKGFAVIELFTSEGCSSCPPADEVASNFAIEYKTRVYILGFHVDYWDRLGWKDGFSDAGYTKRQQQYVTAFNLNSVYTPQVIVNGKSQFVGSEKNKIGNAIQKELETTFNTGIEIRARAKDLRSVHVTYNIKPINGLLINIALVQLHAETSVKRGENGGRYLRHINVVRDFKTLPADKSNKGEALLMLPAGLTKDSCSIIAYTQDSRNMHILSTAGVSIQ